jgi:hypothetical protein
MEFSDDLDVSGGVRLTPAITGRLSKYVPMFQEPPCTAAGGQGTTRQGHDRSASSRKQLAGRERILTLRP